MGASDDEAPVSPQSTDRQLWMAWSDNDGGWIAAIHGSSEQRETIEWRIKREVDELGRGNRFGIRPVRVTIHLADDVGIKP